MGRPRKYVLTNGKTVDGVHYPRATGRYYVIDRRGKQVYFSDLQAASDEHRSSRNAAQRA